jgi:hypothetical protein
MAQTSNANDTSGYQEAFYQAYKTGYEAILQEMNDVYGGRTRVDMLEGERKAYDFLGTIELTQKATRFEDIPIEEMDHNRRWMTPKWYRKGIFVDSEDQILMHTDPTGDYIQALAKGIMRTKNDLVYASFDAIVQGGKDYGDDTYDLNTTAVFSNASEGGRVIVHDVQNDYSVGGTSAGLTIEKLILAREALVDLKNDANQMFNIVCSPRQISDLLREAETQSIDTNIVRSLAAGTVTQYMGFNFIIDYNVTLGSSNDLNSDTDVYKAYAFTNDALLYAQHQSPIFNVDWIPRKQIWQISARCGMNAIRMDEDRIIKIECLG